MFASELGAIAAERVRSTYVWELVIFFYHMIDDRCFQHPSTSKNIFQIQTARREHTQVSSTLHC